jgi:hypothetical protein
MPGAPDHYILNVHGDETEVPGRDATVDGPPWTMNDLLARLAARPELHVGYLFATRRS